MIWIGCLGVVIALAVWPFWRESRLNRMDDTARRDAPGQFVRLSKGLTYFRWAGPPDGPVAICIHGMTTPSYAWDGVVPSLTNMGYRVLTYDHYGRGYSDRPIGLQDRRFFIDHLDELLADQNVTGPLTVLGYSMGGAIATAFTAEKTDRVTHLALIAAAGIRLPKLGLLARLSLKPGIGDWLMRATYARLHRKGVEEERFLPTAVPNIVDRQLAELTYQGFVPSVLASYRGIISEDVHPDHRKIAAAGIPVLAVLGETDPLIPPSVEPVLTDLNEAARVSVIKGAGHGVPYTHADDVSVELRDFLRPNPS